MSGSGDEPPSGKATFRNASASGEIPSFNGDLKAKATDFANYFCRYACVCACVTRSEGGGATPILLH
jgi:hypothetical protein